MSYFMTEEQQVIQKSVHEFCQSPETKKVIAEDNKKGGFAWGSWKLLADMGYIGVAIPEEYGGQGRDCTTELIVVEALGAYGHPCLEALAAHNLGMMPILYWGTEEQKQKYLVPLASGKNVCCGALTDPAGSLNFGGWGFDPKKDGDDYILNGSKVTVTNVEASDIKIIFGKNDAGGDFGKMFVVEKGTPGLETGHQEARVVPGPSDWGTLTMKNVRVPKEDVIIDNGFGAKWTAPSFNLAALLSLTLGQAAFGMALNYTKQRTRYGRPLTDLQAVSHRLVNMAIKNESGKTLIYTAARLWDEGRYDESVRLSSMAKAYVCESTTQNVHDATVLHGGVGYTPQSIIGVLNAMVVSTEIAEIPPDVHRDIVAETYGIATGWKNGRP
jgi:Acyl-CoA dehydrogenases